VRWGAELCPKARRQKSGVSRFLFELRPCLLAETKAGIICGINRRFADLDFNNWRRARFLLNFTPAKSCYSGDQRGPQRFLGSNASVLCFFNFVHRTALSDFNGLQRKMT